MLLFRYIIPDINLKEKNKYSKDPPLSLERWLDKREVLNNTNDPANDWHYLHSQICSTKRICQGQKFDYMREDFLPKSLHPVKLESFAGSYTKYCLFEELLEIYRKYVKENKIDIGSSNERMNKLLQTVIIIEDYDKVRILTKDIILRSLLKEKVKEYVKFGLSYTEEERKYEKGSRYMDSN